MAGLAYRTVSPVYRSLQRLKNAAAGFVDPAVVVLLYHRVTDLASDPAQLAVTPEHFRQQMSYLKSNFNLVRLEEEWSGLSEPAVAITFDDGYADNLLQALPILEEIGAPATFFISTGNIDTDLEFWWDRMARILIQSSDLPASFTLKDRQFGQRWLTGTTTQRQSLYEELSALAQKVGPERLEGWLEQLARWSGQEKVGAGMNRSLTGDELQLLAGNPWVTIGAHTVSHVALSALSPEQQRREIFASKESLEKRIGKSVELFSYPFGNRKHYNRTSLALCREAGFVKAAANFPGQVHRWTDRYQLPRQVVRNWDLDTFSSNLKNWI